MFFIPCCSFSLSQEAGFCDVQGDPGGATNHGITIAKGSHKSSVVLLPLPMSKPSRQFKQKKYTSQIIGP